MTKPFLPGESEGWKASDRNKVALGPDELHDAVIYLVRRPSSASRGLLGKWMGEVSELPTSGITSAQSSCRSNRQI